jgi:hypothetical protein
MGRDGSATVVYNSMGRGRGQRSCIVSDAQSSNLQFSLFRHVSPAPQKSSFAAGTCLMINGSTGQGHNDTPLLPWPEAWKTLRLKATPKGDIQCMQGSGVRY